MELIYKIITEPFVSLSIGMFLALVTYILNKRAKKLNSFYDQIQTSMKLVYNPMLNELKKIKYTHNFDLRTQLVSEFFQSYVSKNSNIHCIDRKSIITAFYDLYEEFCKKEYTLTGDLTETFWKNFNTFLNRLEREYWSCHAVIYRENNWLKYIWNQSLFFRVANQLGRLFFEVSIFLWGVSLLFLYFSFANRVNFWFTKEYIFGIDIFPTAFIILVLTSMLLALGLLFGMNFLFRSYSEETLIDFFIKLVRVIKKLVRRDKFKKKGVSKIFLK